MVRWSSVAPLATPVVPPVYCSTATSSGPRLGPAERHRPAGGDRVVELEVTGQRPGRDHLADRAHDEVDNQALGKAQKITERAHHDMLHRRAGDRSLQGRCEVLQHDHCLGAGILQLVLELARGVERIDVDRDQARPPHGSDRDRVLQHVGHHDRHARPLLEATALQPGGERLGERVDLTKAERLVHADIGLGIAVLGEALLEERHEAGIDGRVDVRRDARRIVLEPEPLHAFPCIHFGAL